MAFLNKLLGSPNKGGGFLSFVRWITGSNQSKAGPATPEQRIDQMQGALDCETSQRKQLEEQVSTTQQQVSQLETERQKGQRLEEQVADLQTQVGQSQERPDLSQTPHPKPIVNSDEPPAAHSRDHHR